MSPRPAGQLSMPDFPSQAGHRDKGQSFLFTRDLPLGVMPIAAQRDRPEYDVRLEPANKTLELLLIDALDIGHIRSHDLPDVLVEFVQTTTQHLAYFGEVYFELVPSELGAEATAEAGEEPAGATKPGPNFPMIAALPPGKVRRIPFRYLQVIPNADREHAGGKRFIAIPAERIWHVKLPASLGCPRAYRRMLERLSPLDGLTPDFAMDIGNMGQSVGYDTTLYHAACAVRREQLTKKWGRIPSLFQIDGPTEYHSLARMLQWQQTQAVIREHIIAELNGLFERLGLEHRLIVTGLPHPEEMGVAVRRMQAGEITVAEAMEVGRV